MSRITQDLNDKWVKKINEEMWQKLIKPVPEMIKVALVDIIESDLLIKKNKRMVFKTWTERLFSWPWKPWKFLKVIEEYVPDDKYYFIDGKVYCHPELKKKLVSSLESSKINLPDPWGGDIKNVFNTFITLPKPKETEFTKLNEILLKLKLVRA